MMPESRSGAPAPPRRRASYVLHVASVAAHHREGVDPFPAARLRLLRLLDEALDLFEAEPRFQHLTLEGGVMLLEDYLTLRPEYFERVEAAIQAGQLLVGPWYVTPEPSLVSAEALIRNLMLGLRTARIFGRPLLVGYLPEARSLPGCLPQILKGFGIETALTARASGAHGPLELRWTGDDGTQILLGYALRGAPDTLGIRREAAAPYSESGHLLLTCAWDVEEDERARQGVLRAIPAAQVALHDDVFHSNPAAYARALEAYARRAELPATPPESMGGAPPADAHVVRQLHEAERLLTEVVEPLAAWSACDAPSIRTIRRPQALIRTLWQLLLQNHVPAILDGSAGAAVYEALACRLRQIEQTTSALRAALDPEADTTLSIARVVSVSDPGFRVTAARLPEDAERDGLIVRGYNSTESPLMVTLRPWRRFGAVEVVTLDEAPTGGRMGADENGAIHFRAAPRRLLTFWFH